MGLMLSAVILVLLHLVYWGLRLLQLAGAALALSGLALFLGRLWAARRRERSGGARKAMPWVSLVLGGIGVCVLVASSAVLIVTDRLGVFVDM
ncbi:hypothetical protein ACWGDE_23440 [Streptomyces sp. NPDC054956]